MSARVIKEQTDRNLRGCNLQFRYNSIAIADNTCEVLQNPHSEYKEFSHENYKKKRPYSTAESALAKFLNKLKHFLNDNERIHLRLWYGDKLYRSPKAEPEHIVCFERQLRPGAREFR